MACEHIKKAGNAPAKTPQGCEECLEAGTDWVQLRRCLSCGHVGCCDSSPGKHATGHYQSTQHAVMQSFEPGQSWKWCYVDEVQA
jgi:CPA1 family monovalent cation:H+ antiporter